MWFQAKKQQRRTRTARQQRLGSFRRRHESLEQRMLLSIAPNAESFMASNAAAISVAASQGTVANVSVSTSADTNNLAASDAISTLTSVSGGLNVVDQQSVTNFLSSAGNLSSVVQSSFETTNYALPGIFTMDSVSTSAGTNNLAASNAVSTLTTVSGGGLNFVDQQIVTNIPTNAGNLVDQHSVTSIVTSTGNSANAVQSSSETVFQAASNLNCPSAVGVDALMANEAIVDETAVAMLWAAA
jgi:hypothetical protein